MGKHQPFGASNESCMGGSGLVSKGTGEDRRTAVLWNVGNEQVKGRYSCSVLIGCERWETFSTYGESSKNLLHCKNTGQQVCVTYTSRYVCVHIYCG